MKKILIFVIIIILVIGAALIFDKDMFKKTNKNNGQVREAIAAGQFYPAEKAELSSILDEYLNKAEVLGVGERVRALIVPHAGYVYSGQVAAYGYKALIGPSTSSGPIKTIVLIGNSHQEYFE